MSASSSSTSPELSRGAAREPDPTDAGAAGPNADGSAVVAGAWPGCVAPMTSLARRTGKVNSYRAGVTLNRRPLRIPGRPPPWDSRRNRPASTASRSFARTCRTERRHTRATVSWDGKMLRPCRSPNEASTISTPTAPADTVTLPRRSARSNSNRPTCTTSRRRHSARHERPRRCPRRPVVAVVDAIRVNDVHPHQWRTRDLDACGRQPTRRAVSGVSTSID